MVPGSGEATTPAAAAAMAGGGGGRPKEKIKKKPEKIGNSNSLIAGTTHRKPEGLGIGYGETQGGLTGGPATQDGSDGGRKRRKQRRQLDLE